MATVVFDNDGGGGNGLWSLNTNWVGDALPGDADTAQISADCTLDMNDIVAKIIVDSSKTFDVGTYALTGMTLDWENNGTVSGGAGGQLGWVPAGYNAIVLDGKMAFVGTSGSRFSVTNGHATYNVKADPGDLSVLQWVDFQAELVMNVTTEKKITIEDCEFYESCSFNAGTTVYYSAQTIIKRCFFAWSTTVGTVRFACSGVASSPSSIENLVIGYRRDGSSHPANTGVVLVSIWAIAVRAVFRNVVINATTLAEVNYPGACIIFENFGYVPNSMLPGTGSALDTAVAGPGVSYQFVDQGTIQRTTAAKKSGDYGTRATPNSNLTSIQTLETEIYVPIASGQSLAVSVYGRRKTLTDGGTEDTIAEIEIDPEGAWFTPTTSAAVAMTNEEGGSPEWYEFTASASTAGGTGAKGMCRVVLRVKQYTAGGYFDWADAVFTVT